MAPSEQIVIRGAREHNLKDVDLELPRNALIVITGLSGSGKSSLAFDTIYAEGQRRYVESLSAYARQFLGLMEKPDVDSIDGLSPAISIDQKTTSRNPRSTVGTVTEIYDYLRLLWARIGKPHCPECGEPIEGQSIEQITDRVMTLDEGTRFMVMAPVVRGRKGEFENLFEQFRLEGYSRVRVDNELRRLDEEIKLDKKYNHDISVVVDRLVMKGDLRRRLSESVEAAAALAGGVVEVDVLEEGSTGEAKEREPSENVGGVKGAKGAGKLPEGVADRLTFSERFACLNCGTSIPELEPRIFSFNSPHGACDRCHGLGFQRIVDPELVVPDPTLSLSEGALQPWRTGHSRYWKRLIEAVAEDYGVDTDVPWQDLSDEDREIFLYGTGGERHKVTYSNRFGRRRSYSVRFEGIVNNLERRYGETDSDSVRERVEGYMAEQPCPVCKGARLRPESLAVKVGGISIHEYTEMSARAALVWIEELEMTDTERAIARLLVRESHRAARLPRQRRRRLPEPGALGPDAVRRRGAADQARDADRLQPGRRPLHPRRALDRAAPARQREAHPDPRAPPRSGQHGDRGRARRGHDALGRPPRRPRPRRRRARWARDRGGHAEAGGGGPGVAHRPVPRRPAPDRGAGEAPRAAGRAGRQGCPPAQPEGDRRCDPARRLLLRHRRLRLRQVDADQRDALPGGGKPAPPGEAAAGGPRPDRRHRAGRQDHQHRPVADRADAALKPGDLHERLRPHPPAVRPDARGSGARLQAGPLQLQRQGRALRGLPRRRADQDRDALPAGRLRALRAVPRQALQPRDPRDPLQGQVDRRRARDVGRGRLRLLQGHPEDLAAARTPCRTSGSTTSGWDSRRPSSPAARRSG